MVRKFFAATAGAACTILASCNGGTISAPPTVVSYQIAIKSAPPIFAYAGAPVPVAFTVTEFDSDSVTRPASGRTFTIAITSGDGTVNGASTSTVTTGSDGTVAFTWMMGRVAGSQSLRVSAGDQYVDMSLAVLPLHISSVQLQYFDAPAVVYHPFDSTAVRAGETLNIWAELKDSIGNAHFTETTYWQSSNPDVVSIVRDRTYAFTDVTALKPGTAIITATADGKSASARITVTP